MHAPDTITFSRRQTFFIVYGTLRDEGIYAPIAAWVALKNAKPKTVRVRYR